MISFTPKENCILYLAPRPLTVNQVVFRISDTFQSVPSHIATQIEDVWNDIKAKNPKAFNGILVNIQDLEEKDGKVYITANKTDYKTYSFLRKQPNYILFDYGIAAAGTSAVLFTRDKKLVLAERGKGLIGEGMLYSIPGGYCNITDGRFDLEKSIMKELQEELMLTAADIESIAFHGIGYDSVYTKGAELLFSITTRLTADEVSRRHAKAQDVAEASRLVLVEQDRLMDYIKAHGMKIMRGSLANILAYLHHAGNAQAYKLGEVA